MNFTKYIRIFVLFMLLLNFVAAYTPPPQPQDDSKATSSIHNAICSMVELVKASMGAVFLILVVLAAIVYAAGQVLGAETRARANVWATSMFVGAIIGGLIYLVIPVFLTQLLGQDVGAACGAEAQNPNNPYA